jgi:hypothetical protein
MKWSKQFESPIVLANGRKLITLADAADYIAALPSEEQNAPDWRLAMEALNLASERRDYEQLARAVVMRALEPPTFSILLH